VTGVRRARAALPTLGAAVASVIALHACVSEPLLGAADPDAGSRDAGDAAVSTGPVGPTSSVGNDAGEAGGGDGGDPTCDAQLASMLAGALAPPYVYAGLDLVRGTDPKGLTVDEVDTAGCAKHTTTASPGYRSANWGGVEGVTLTYNMESRIIYEISLGRSYRGTMQFQSSSTSPYGAHTYEMGISFLHRDGVDMPIDWNDLSAPWVNELNRALIYTFAPDPFGGPTDCRGATTCMVLDDDGGGESLFGARSIGLYVRFVMGTSQVIGIYDVWRGGMVDCTTPRAAREAMDYAPILDMVNYGDLSIGGVRIARPPPNGITWQAADALLCGGVKIPAEDEGYGAIQWGEGGEVELEYNLKTDIAYKLTAKNGYRGTYDGQDSHGNTYSIEIGKITKNGAPIAFDPSSRADVTALSNAYSGADDADCVAAGDCLLTADNGKGQLEIELVPAQVHLVFAKGNRIGPDSIYIIWPKGK